MKPTSRLLACLVCLLPPLITAASLRAADDVPLRGYLQQHCYDCHTTNEAEAQLQLDRLAVPTASGEHFRNWARILEVVESGEMPPPEHPRPSEAETQKFVQQVVGALAATVESRPPALRRLNRREYENTVHELLGVDVPLLDLLPADGNVQGFDNVADGLNISSVLMEQYLEAANVAFDAAIRRFAPLPVETRRAELMSIKDNIESVAQNKGGTIESEGAFVKFTPGWPPARVDAVHPIEPGKYRCRIAVWPHDPSERTIALAIYVGSLFGPETREFIGVYDVTGSPKEPRIIEFTAHFEEGHSIHIVPRIWPEHVTWRDKHEPRPGVAILWAETHGPLDQAFPSLAQQRLFASAKHIRMEPQRPLWMRHRKGVQYHVVDSDQAEADAAAVIADLLPRAFRRPVSTAEAEPFIGLTLGRLAAGRSFEEAVRAGVCAVLCSPQFLLLNQESEVDDYTLASRLSYFLWSTMPDERLLQLAADGQLAKAEVRHAEVERMIADPRIANFVENFTGQWLGQRDIDFTTPDAKLYPEFDPLLQHAMLGETREFFEHVLHENLSVMNFIDSDFTFVNQRLADHYGLTGVRGHEHFQKIELPEESIRGGVLAQASVLKVTANGTTTSPVIRGVWVLDHLLARPAPPPPPGVPAVEPDIRGATSIREQLDMHRNIAQCNSCHKRIDPPGFALEEFDAIGGERRWYRSLGEGEKVGGKVAYKQGPDVETGADLPDGRAFANFKEYRACLLADRPAVARGIATKLLVYGTGRAVTPADRPAVDAVVSHAEKENLGLKSMIHAVVDSPLFLAP